MASISSGLLRAMESDCAVSIEEIVAARRPKDLAALRGVLRDASVPESFRQHAVQILGRWADRKSATAIRAILPNLDERERINAVDALGRIGGAEAEAAVLDMTHDTSSDVRRFAAYALSKLKTEAARNRLSDMEGTDPERSVRAAAARSLRVEQ